MEETYFLVFLLVLVSCVATQRPNIVFIVADDLGWNDVGFRNPNMKTPNIDKLATEGIIFESAYVQPYCSPSRTAFMSGMFPFKVGMQHIVIGDSRPACVPLNYTFLPQELKKLGYATHMVGKYVQKSPNNFNTIQPAQCQDRPVKIRNILSGKTDVSKEFLRFIQSRTPLWHLGFCRWECTPTYRGFDTFFGYYTAQEGYFNHSTDGYLDYRDNKLPAWDYKGEYSAYTFAQKAVDIINQHNVSQPLFLYLPYQSVHDPMEVPVEYFNMYPNVMNQGRRTYSGMVTALDDAVGNVTMALKEKGLFENTLILFTADNGGPITSYANNWPLRGGKHTIWEGGTRGTSFMYGTGLKKTKTTYNGMMHAVDWKPTLVSAAGGTPEMSIDGISHWESIRKGLPSSRTEFIYNLDNFEPAIEGHAGIRVGDYKLIMGYPGGPDGWHQPMNRTERDIYVTTIYVEGDSPVHLYNIRDDPTEHNDLAQKMPDIVNKLKTRMDDYRKQMVPADYPPPDPAANPKNFGNAWTPGWC